MTDRVLGINNLAPGFVYDVRVRGIFNGQYSEWGPVETIDLFSDVSGGTLDKAPSAPTNFVVSATIDSFILTWDAPTTNSDASILRDMKEYVVEVRSASYAGTAAAVYTLPEVQKPSDLAVIDRAKTFEFTYKMNRELFGGLGNAGPYFTIYSRDTTNNKSTVVQQRTLNASPSAPTSLTATAVVGGANVSWGGGTSNDIVAYTLKYSTSTGFNPVSAGTEAYRGNLTNFSFSGVTGTPYYFRVGSVDVFGTTSWYATEATATPLPTITYNTPAAPTVFTNSYVGANYRIGWTASASAAVDVQMYKVDVTANSVLKSFYTSDVFLDIDPNMGKAFGAAWPYTPSVINVYTVGPSGLTSGALAGTGIVTAPATPTAPVLTPSIGNGGIALTWTSPSDPNRVIDEVQVYANTVTTASPTNAAYAGAGAAGTAAGFTYSLSPIFNGTYYFKSRVLDIFGRFSGYSAEATQAVSSIGVPTALSTSSALDPADTVNSTSIITVNWTNPATITYNGTKIRYRLTGGLWTEVDVGSFGGPSAAATYNLRNLVPGATYIVDVAAYDFKGTLGTWTSASAGQLAASDATAPSSALSPTTSTGATSILVRWTGVNTTTDKDAINGNGRYDVELNTLDTFLGTAIKQTSPTGASLEPMSAAFTGLTGGTTYYARVRAVDWTGNAGSWNVYGGGVPTATVVGQGALVYSTPNNPSAIVDSWVGANYRISWTAATGTATDILKYKVDVLANAITKTYYTTGTAIEIDPASAKTFGATFWPAAITSVTVTTLGPTGLQSAGLVKNTAFTAAPTTPTAPALTSTFNSSGIAISWSAPSDPNSIIDQIEVYANTATTASPTNAVYSGLGTGFNYSVSPLFSGTYYFKSRVLDKFGRYSAAYSAEDTEVLVSVGLPTAMSVVSTLDEADLTNRTAKVAVNFTINNTTSYGGTRIRYKVSSTSAWTEVDLGSFGGAAAGAVTYYLRGLIPGAIYNVEIAHYSFAGTAGSWAVPVTSPVTAASDATGPVSALAPTHAAGLTTLSVNWTGVNTGTNPGDSDAVNGNGRYDVEIATNTGFSLNVVRKVMTTGASAAAMSTTFGGLTAGTIYYSRVRAVDITGNVGSWYPVGGVGTETTATIGSVTVTYNTPASPTLLVESYVGANYRISWTPSVSSAADIKHYKVEVTANSTLKTYYTTDNFIDIDPQAGKDFGSAWPYIATLMNIYTVGPTGLQSTPALNKNTGFTTAPAVPTPPTLTATLGTTGERGINVTWTAPSDPSNILDAVVIYAGTTAAPTTPVYSGRSTSFNFPVSPTHNGTYFFNSRVRDIYGRFSAYSADASQAVTTLGATTVGTVTGSLDTADPTLLTAMLNVTWTNPASQNYNGTFLRYRLNATTNWTVVDVGRTTSTLIRNLIPGKTYNLDIIAYDFNGTLGNSSTWTSFANQTVTADAGLPATPTQPTLAVNAMEIQVTQPTTANAADTDLRLYEVYAGTTTLPTTKIGTMQWARGATTVIATFKVPATDAGTPANTQQQWFVRTKAVDWTGNVSAAYSTENSGNVPLISATNISSATITEAKIGTLSAGKITTGTFDAGRLGIYSTGTNFIPIEYCGFENRASTYTSLFANSLATTSVVTTQQRSGSQALQIVTSSATTETYFAPTSTSYNMVGAANETYIVSMYIKSNAGTPTIKIRFKASTGAVQNFTTAALTTGWVRYSAAFLAPISTTGFQIGVADLSIAGTVFIDDVMVEKAVGNGTAPSQFVSSTATVIDGNGILTGTVNANRLEANSAIVNSIDVGNTSNSPGILTVKGTTGKMQSDSYVTSGGTTGWKLDNTGLDIKTGTITAGALLVGGDSTNMIPAPYSDFEFSATTEGVILYGPGGTYALQTIGTTPTLGVSQTAKFGSQSLSCTITGAGQGFRLASSDITYPYPVTNGRTYIVSVYVQVTATQVVTLGFKPSLGADTALSNVLVDGVSTSTVTTGAFRRISGTFTAASETTVHPYITFAGTSGEQRIDGFMMEERLGALNTPSAFIPFTKIDGSGLTSGSISGDQIASGAITADMIATSALSTQQLGAVNSLIQNLILGADENGQRVEADGDGLRVIDGSGNVLVDLPTDPLKRPKFNGDLIAQNLEVIGASILGQTTIGQGTEMELLATQDAPGSSPSVSISYPSTVTLGGTGAAQKQWFQLGYNALGTSGLNTPCFYSARPSTSGYWRYVEEYIAATGAYNRTLTLPYSTDDIWGMTTLGAFIYVLYKNTSTGDYWLIKYSISTLLSATETKITSTLTSARPGLGNNGTDLFVVCGASQGSANEVNLRTLRYNTSLTLLTNVTHNTLQVDTNESGGGRTTEFGGILWHAPSSRWFIPMYSYDGASVTRRRVYAFSGTITTANGLTYTVEDDFHGSLGAEADGIAYDGTSIYTIIDSVGLTKHTDWTWDLASTTAKYWVGFSWRDNIGKNVSCTFTDTGDTVNAPAHGLVNGTTVQFARIVGTTGISVNTTYYVVAAATNTFQVAATSGGVALALTTNGYGGYIVGCTFQTTPANTVTSTAHGMQDGTSIVFTTINTTTGISTNTTYYVRDTIGNPNTFKVASTPGGGALTLTTNGTGFYVGGRAVTLQDADTVTLTAHGLTDGQVVTFPRINTTTGISINTSYFVRDTVGNPNTFKLASTIGGGAINLTTAGTGIMEAPLSGAPHETTVGPRTSITARKRAGLKVTTTTIPGAGGLDDPNSHRVYINRSAFGTTTEPQANSRFDGRLQLTNTLETNIIENFNTGGQQNLAGGTFPGGIPAKLSSSLVIPPVQGTSAGVGWSIDGAGIMQGIHPDIQTFTTTGSSLTWYKPADAGYTEAEIIMIGGGGGGGGGRRSNASAAAGGGSGGGGGAYGSVKVPLSFLSATATITVGAGGAAVAGQTVTNPGTNGNAGADSTLVSGSYTLTARGGVGGLGGSLTAGGLAQSVLRDSSAGIWPGGAGADGSINGVVGVNAVATPSAAANGGAGGGGGGGGTNGTSNNGMGGDGAKAWDVAGTVGRAGATPVTTPTAKATGWAYPGGGAGGSGGNWTANVADGGTGGLYGGGGGGGGGTSGQWAGGGGAGAQGIVVIICR